ncbi:MAG: MBOAT family protein [Lachnospiraceae bacterium]|nr:MBOAT family protein [Lachnospiraceae bacterium]
MIFADLLFLYVFLPLLLIACLAARYIDSRRQGMGVQNAVLIFFSLLFYAWGEPVFILLLLLSVVVTWALAKKGACRVGIVYHLVMLVVFKYGNLLFGPLLTMAAPGSALSIHLPIGISFYTFQSISYLADVRSCRCEAQPKLSRLLLYITMFPQLIAGPIVRYQEIEKMMEERTVTDSDIAEGISRIIRGLAKKVILADQLSEIVTHLIGEQLPGTTPQAVLGLVCFSMQIYFDFSGYSDMAIGMGRCLGFTFPENFNAPYQCCSVTDFWRRWHMTLGRFFRDYVYIPLGGGRAGRPAVIRNILITWMLTGFWHGASWNFLLWGLYFGILLLLERALWKDSHDRVPAHRAGRVLWRILTAVLVILGWGIFYFDDFGRMAGFFVVLFTGGIVASDLLFVSQLTQNAFLLIIGLVLCFVPTERICALIRDKIAARLPFWCRGILRGAAASALLIIATLLLVGATNHPFLYTRF